MLLAILPLIQSSSFQAPRLKKKKTNKTSISILLQNIRLKTGIQTFLFRDEAHPIGTTKTQRAQSPPPPVLLSLWCGRQLCLALSLLSYQPSAFHCFLRFLYIPPSPFGILNTAGVARTLGILVWGTHQNCACFS